MPAVFGEAAERGREGGRGGVCEEREGGGDREERERVGNCEEREGGGNREERFAEGTVGKEIR